jgi:Domain of unknown function (DUF4832)/Domain of unknown function (DUF4874)
MKRLLIIFFLTYSLCAFSQTVISYTPSTAEIANPGRGLYTHRETLANAGGNMISPLTATDVNLQRSSKNITLIFRLFYLDQFKASAISSSYLIAIQTDFNTIRTSGAKAIVRFAYNQTNQTHLHNDDASKFWVLAHIAQLKNILQNNSDVIFCLQAGFVGTWGEGYYTHPDFTNADLTPNYTNRKEVIDSLLSAMPKDKMIQIRTPYYKYNSAMYGNGSSGTSAALQLPNAYTDAAIARVAHHNDCFLASSSDYGTYINITNDKNYLEQDTKYLINGGEVCNDNPTYTNCINAQAELKRLHFTFLNNDYNTTVLNRWNTEGCLQNAKNNLGYRLELIDGTYTDNAKPGYTYNINFNVRNVGYAPPYERKQIRLILKNNATNVQTVLILSNLDSRYWLPDSTYNINISAGIGKLPQGTYSLYFAIKDGAVSIANNPLQSIQFANTGVWDATLGYNLLKNNISISSANVFGTLPYTGNLWFGCNCL